MKEPTMFRWISETGFPDVFQSRWGRDIVSIIAIFVVCAFLTWIDFSIEAFTDYDALGLMVFAIPFFACAYFWIRAKSTKNPHFALLITIGVLLAHVALNIVGGDWVEAMVIRVRVDLSKDYARKCDAVDGIPIYGGELRICERRWHMADELAAVVKFDGDTTKLGDGEANKKANWNKVNMFLPFGVMKYRATHITGQYYLLNFSSGNG